jgi:hypothetical protein
MAENKEIAFDLEVKGVEQSISSVKELKNAIKAAKDEQLKAAQVYGESSAEFKKASASVANLKDKVEDLNDATKTVKGSGVEKVTESFSQLGEGLRTLDTDKIKTGFRGLGAAMSAIPIFLLIEGLKYLVENFEEVSKAIKTFFNVATEAEKGIRKLEQAQKDLKDANSLVITSLENEVKILEAQGASQEKILGVKKKIIEQKIKEAEIDIQLQKAKIAEILANDNLTESYYRQGAANARLFGQKKEAAAFDALLAKEKSERSEEAINALKTDLITIQNLKTQEAVNQITNDKKVADEYKKQNTAKLESDKAYYAEKNRLALENEKSLNDALKSLNEVVKGEKLVAEEDDAKLTFTRKEFTQDELNNMQREKFMQNELAMSNYSLQVAQTTTQSLQSLSDLYFMVKNKNLQKGTAAELKAAEQQFKINKALAITSAVISGIQGVINALSAQSVIPEPFGTILKVASAVGIGIAAAANVAKIASTKFSVSGGGGGGGSASLPSSPPIPSPPSISTKQNNTNQSTSFDETGKKIGGDSEKKMNPVIQVKATVGVDEVSNKQNRVDTLEKQSTF